MGKWRRFVFRLALALGKTVGELLDSIDSRELTEWQIFDSIDPIGAWRDDYASGLLCALQANMNRRKGAKAFVPQDFMPFVPRDSEPASAEAMEHQFMAYIHQHNKAYTQPPNPPAEQKPSQ